MKPENFMSIVKENENYDKHVEKGLYELNEGFQITILGRYEND